MTEGGSIVAMSYYGAEKVVPHYNVMGVAKAALEASTRYLAYDLGPKKVRVNCISAGPVNTLAARGISGFTEMLKHYEAHAPLKRNVLPEELGATGTFLASDGAAAGPFATPKGPVVLVMVHNRKPIPQTFATARSQVADDFTTARIAQLQAENLTFLRRRADISIAPELR